MFVKALILISKVFVITVSILLLIAALCRIYFQFIRPSKTYKFLSRKLVKLLDFLLIDCIDKVSHICSRILHRIYALLFLDFYAEELRAKIQHKFRAADASNSSDLKRQHQLIVTDRDSWKSAYYKQQSLNEERYWDGIKAGHKASENSKSLREVKKELKKGYY
jgi:hypothetical protein